MIFTDKSRILSEANRQLNENRIRAQTKPQPNNYLPIEHGMARTNGMGMMMNTRVLLPHTQSSSAVQPPKSTNLREVIQNSSSSATTTKKMRWGEPTWFLFHTLAEKVKEDRFLQIRMELLNVINTICNNLPCPNCAQHASEYMNNLNFNAIQTKQQLKHMLFVFHNEVNKRKGVPLFPETELDAKYSTANLLPILQTFMHHFEDKHYGYRMMASDFSRSNIAANLKQWFAKNINSFAY
jgi:hypothetical protein